METILSQESEEYIEAIYKIQKRNGIAKTSELAKELHVVPGSITNTITHLETHDLVEHKPYRGVRLTKKGEKLALDIIRRHRLAERLLTDILDAKWNEVHENACKLEHALTQEVVDLLEKKLGNPKICPHGNPIPTKNGEIEEEQCHPLTEMELDEFCSIAKITDENKEKLQKLAEKGIKLNIPIHIIRKKPSTIILCVNGKECSLPYSDASSIWVKRSGRNNHAIQT